MALFKGARLSLGILLLSSVVARTEVRADEQAPDCPPLFRRLAQKGFEAADQTRDKLHSRKLRKEKAGFDYDAFEEAKLFYGENGLTAKVPETDEERLALLEAASGKTQYSDEWGARAQRSALQTLKEIFPKDKRGNLKPIRRATLEKALIDHYEKAHGVPDSVRSYFTEGAKERLRRSILAREEKEIQRKGVERAFDDLGLLKEPGIQDRLREFRRQHDGQISLIANLAMDIPMVSNLHIPGFFPKSPFGKPLDLPPELARQIREEGIDSAYPKLKTLFFKMVEGEKLTGYDRAAFDHYWNTFRNFYNVAVTGYFGALFVENAWQAVRDHSQEFEASEEERKDAERQIEEKKKMSLYDHAREYASEHFKRQAEEKQVSKP